MQYQSVNQLVSLDAIDDHSNFIFSSIEYFILNNIIFIWNIEKLRYEVVILIGQNVDPALGFYLFWFLYH
jgi:hypothetical protein